MKKKNPIGLVTSVAIKAILVAIILIDIKILLRYFGFEFLTNNALFTSIVSGNIFILGFLLNSTLNDYKEAERLPGELASSIETIYDECEIIYRRTQSQQAKECIEYLSDLAYSITKWFHKEEYTRNIMGRINRMNEFSAVLEKQTAANYLVRIKTEQNNIRRIMNRVNTIRDIPFYTAAYRTAVVTVTSMIIGLELTKSDHLYTSIFSIGLISFINLYLLGLIKDLDNPFEYSKKKDDRDEVPLKPLIDLQKRMRNKFAALKGSRTAYDL